MLARLFTTPDAASWVLKGAGALLARLLAARHSMDIDVYFAEQSAAGSDATAALRRAMGRDLGGFFGFEVTKSVPLQEGAKGSQVHLRAMPGAKTFAVFHIDVVGRDGNEWRARRGCPVDAAACRRSCRPVLSARPIGPSYRAFPLSDHVADKFAAILGTHVRGETGTGSSRIKDLVDIALIATTQQISGPALSVAILAGAAHRNLTLPDAFEVPVEAV